MWTFLGLLLLAAALFYRWRKEKFSFFEKLGLPGPKPNLIWGNYLDLKLTHLSSIGKWVDEYGDTFGAFWGDIPMVITKDLGLIQKVCIKEFSSAPNRTKQFPLDGAHPFMSKQLIGVTGEKWKSLRSLISPSFTARKMKLMMPLFEKGVDQLVQSLDKAADSGKGIDMYPYYKRLTIDNIGRTGFGVDANSHADPDNLPLIAQYANNFINVSIQGIPDVISASFSGIGRVMNLALKTLFKFGAIKHSIDDFARMSCDIVKARQAGGMRRDDLLQSMIDAEGDDNVGDLTMSLGQEKPEDDADKKKSSRRSNGLKLHYDEIVANTILFVIAGYETTSTALGFVTQCLARYPDVQERVRQEILEDLDIDNIDYYKLLNLTYLDQVISEGLRIRPPITGFNTRETITDITHEGRRYPAKTGFLFPVYQIHHDDRYWPNHDEFDPDRFSPENKKQILPQSFLAFGDGPRNCIGMRLALVQVKLVLAKLLTRYRLHVDEANFKFTEKFVLIQPDIVSVKLERL